MPGKFQPQPPRQNPLFETDQAGKSTGVLSKAWYQWLALLPARLTSPAQTGTPVNGATPTPGVPGQVLYDANFLYVCVANNQWKRSALSAF